MTQKLSNHLNQNSIKILENQKCLELEIKIFFDLYLFEINFVYREIEELTKFRFQSKCKYNGMLNSPAT